MEEIYDRKQHLERVGEYRKYDRVSERA